MTYMITCMADAMANFRNERGKEGVLIVCVVVCMFCKVVCTKRMMQVGSLSERRVVAELEARLCQAVGSPGCLGRVIYYRATEGLHST